LGVITPQNAKRYNCTTCVGVVAKFKNGTLNEHYCEDCPVIACGVLILAEISYLEISIGLSWLA
jgi:hypothetical protein